MTRPRTPSLFQVNGRVRLSELAAALGREAIFKAPWVAVVPGTAIALAILGFNLTGDWLATRGRRQGSS